MDKLFFSMAPVLIVVVVVALGYRHFLTDPRPPAADVSNLHQHHSDDIVAVASSPAIAAGHRVKNIRVRGDQFIAPDGRSMFLRGINLGGTTKMPYSPYVVSHVRENFFDGENISFVGRPFPLAEADEHFNRLKQWGFHFIRLLVTWEAIEHQGPGRYDQQYLDYLKQLVQLAAAHDLNVFIDPHQDVWSRYSGGSGAPLWTFEVAGLDPRQFSATGAALVHNVEGDPLTKMIWFTNNYKLAAATMWTLFFAGNDFAPQLKVAVTDDGEPQPIQDYLQQHFNAAMEQVAIALQGMPNVIGFEYINEPSAGYIGLEDLTAPFKQALFGDTPTPAQSMFLAAGYPQTVSTAYVGLLDIEQGEARLLNSEQAVAWVDRKPDRKLDSKVAGKVDAKTTAAATGVWQQHGVWGLDQQGRPVIKKPDYFSQVDGRSVDFSADYFKPAIDQYKARIRAVDPEWTLFVSPSLFPDYAPLPVWGLDESDNMVNAKHWYDDITLVKKQFMPYVGLNAETHKLQFGVKKVREFIEKMLAQSTQETHHALGNAPTLIGETGIPFDMNDRQAFRNGDFSQQAKAADRVFNALEKNLLHYTWWNYTADNNNERGDQWNGEDLSVFSRDQQLNKNDVNSGGRALSAIVRPYPYKVAGRIIEYRFNRLTGELVLRYQTDKKIAAPTEIFLPSFHYGKGYTVFSHSGEFRQHAEKNLLMFYPAEYDKEQIIVVRPSHS